MFKIQYYMDFFGYSSRKVAIIYDYSSRKVVIICKYSPGKVANILT